MKKAITTGTAIYILDGEKNMDVVPSCALLIPSEIVIKIKPAINAIAALVCFWKKRVKMNAMIMANITSPSPRILGQHC